MARTNLPLSTFTSGADLNDAGTSVDQANGMNVALASTAIPAGNGSESLVLYVTNTSAGTATVTVRKGVGGGATAGAAMRSGIGDLTTGNLSASTGTAFIGPFDPMRFAQADGSLNIDFSSGFTGKIWAILLPPAPTV